MSARIFPVILCAALAGACGGREQAAQRFVEHGDGDLAAGRYASAVIEYRNAVKQRPGWAEAYRKLGDAYMAQGDSEEAYRAYANAIELAPSDIHSQLQAGRLLFAAGRYDEALVRAEHALERDDRSTDAQVLWGRTLGRMNRYDEALSQLEEAVAFDHRAEVYNAVGEVKLASGDRAGAEEAFRAAVKREPSSVDAHLALAQFFTATGNSRDAERELRQVAAAHPDSEAAQRAAASFYLAAKRDADAEPYLRAAAALPNQQLKSTLALADFLIAQKRFADSAAVLQPVAGALEGPAKVRLAAIALETGSPADARRILDAAMKKQTTAEALSLNAELLRAEGKPDAALAAARSALELDSSNATAHVVAGSIEFDKGYFDKAEAEYRAVLPQDRMAHAANLQLARIKLVTGDPADAIAFAEAAGTDATARLTLARALVGAGQTAKARVELRRIEAGGGASAEAAVLLGWVELHEGRTREARAEADRALAIEPNRSDALMLAARCALASHDAAAAEQLLARAVAADPRSFDAHLLLAQLRATRGDVAGARSTIETIAARRPDVAAARTALGIVLEASNRPGDAKARYEQALAIDPGEPVAANNLARIYAADDARTAEAIELARTAVARLPNDAAAHDTLGWIAYKAGRLQLAKSSLERAVALEPRDAAAQAHLQRVRAAIDAEARVKAAEAAERAKLLPDESKEAVVKR